MAATRRTAQMVRKCRHCWHRATWQSKVNGAWLCARCHPCWCNYCMGRVNAHGNEAVALYAKEAQAAGCAPESSR